MGRPRHTYTIVVSKLEAFLKDLNADGTDLLGEVFIEIVEWFDLETFV
jgi:hypothetical protein